MGIRPDDVVVSAHGSVPAVLQRPSAVQPGSVQCTVAGVRVIAAGAPDARPPTNQIVRLRLDHYVLFDPVTDRAIT
jgi:hypothetical protein